MSSVNVVTAIRDTLHAEMAADDRIVLLGEDVGTRGGVFKVSQGFMEEFGEQRVIDTPLAESGIVGVAIGMALHGMLPVAEIEFADFIHPASTRSSRRRRACGTARTGTGVARWWFERRAAAASTARCTTPSRSRRSTRTCRVSRS